jgi:hypothetical protein
MLGLVNMSAPALPEHRLLTRAERRRDIRSWRSRQFLRYRRRELGMELGLAATRVVRKTGLLPGLNQPWHGRLYATVFRSHRAGWHALGADKDFAYFKISGQSERDTKFAIPLTEALRNGWLEIIDYGHVGCHLIVTAGKNYVAACFDNTNEPESLKFHGFGTGTNAANVSDVGLQTELTTEYAVNSTRPTGSQAHASATYTTVGTLSPDSGGTLAITEWGLFSASSSTTLYDRQVFSAINLVAGSDSLATTYVLTQG